MLVETALSGDSALYFLVMIQAQESGEAAMGDPEVLVGAYPSFVQGLALLVFQGRGLEDKMAADVLTSVVRARRP